MVHFIEELFSHARSRRPITLREDFCGTAHLASTWVRSGDGRAALGVDCDPNVLDWARRHNVDPLGRDAARLPLRADDVMAVDDVADALVSLNFSHWVYHDRAALSAYVQHAYACIEPGGLFICDAFGGPASITPCIDERPFGDFTYRWQQVSFDPITHRIRCAIHFAFRNGTEMRNAFSYDWRMWSLPEMQELLTDAGFGDIGIYFESEDGFIADFDAVDFEAWVAYLVALKD